MTGFAPDRAADAVRKGLGLAPGSGGPSVAVVLGSGLGEAAAAFETGARMPYGQVPGLGPCRVPGHAGTLALGRAAGLDVLFFLGRRHYYESGSMAEAALTARLAAALGVRFLVLLSAVGSADPSLGVGEWVYVADHVNLMGRNPLEGVSGPEGPPFLDLTGLYRVDLCREAARRASGEFLLHPAVLAAFAGPTYETPAEVRMARALGAEVVGMSTVPEAVWARHLGLETAAFGRVVNLAAGVGSGTLRHGDVLREASLSAPRAARIVALVLEAWAGAAA